MFRALAQGHNLAAQTDAAREGGPPDRQELLPEKHETAGADSIRQAVCEELLKRRDEIAVFIDDDFDSYVARMRRSHIWGGARSC